MKISGIVILLSLMRALYSAVVEGAISCLLINGILFFIPGTGRVSFLVCYIPWLIIGFIVACIQNKKLID